MATKVSLLTLIWAKNRFQCLSALGQDVEIVIWPKRVAEARGGVRGRPPEPAFADARKILGFLSYSARISLANLPQSRYNRLTFAHSAMCETPDGPATFPKENSMFR